MEVKILHIPSDSFALETELKQKKSKYMDHIYKVFESNFTNNQITSKKLKMFQFRGTNLVVILNQSHFQPNLKILLDYYIELEEFEKCKVINNIINYINNDNNSK